MARVTTWRSTTWARWLDQYQIQGFPPEEVSAPCRPWWQCVIVGRTGHSCARRRTRHRWIPILTDLVATIDDSVNGAESLPCLVME